MKVKNTLWILLLLLPACTGGSSSTQPAAATSDAAITQAVAENSSTAVSSNMPPAETTAPEATAATPPTTTVLPENMYVNPVLDRDFPDPDVLKVEDIYFAFASSGNGHNIQAASSADLVEWDVLSDALPALPDWAVQEFGWAWAPEVTVDASGERYLMYFTARLKKGVAGGVQCIGLAIGEQPEGPYRPEGEAPFICQEGEGGSIDASSFVDEDGTRYLLWKNDGNSRGGQTWIYIQQVSGDGTTLIGEPNRLFRADKVWEGIVVEGPTLWEQHGKYYLFYSANDYTSPRYAVGLATADHPLGPYEKNPEPFLATILPAGIVGPGGQDVVLDPDGDPWLLFHSWDAGAFRNLNLAPLVWEGDMLQVGELTRDPMLEP